MFNRTLQVKMIKNKELEQSAPDQKETTLEGKAAIIGYYTERAISKAGRAALAYVVLDTFRKVVVAWATKR